MRKRLALAELCLDLVYSTETSSTADPSPSKIGTFLRAVCEGPYCSSYNQWCAHSLSLPKYSSLADYLAIIYSTWINEWVFKLSSLWLALVTSIHQKGRLWLTKGNTADLSGKRPHQLLGSRKKTHKTSKWKTCFSFSNSRDLKCPPFFSEKGTYLLLAIILYVFCQQLINISADGLSKKNMFFCLYQLFTSLLYTIAGESEQWGRWG